MKKVLYIFGNMIHLVMICILGYCVFRAIVFADVYSYTGNFCIDLINVCSKIGINEIFTFIGAVAFVLFGVVGIYEFSYINGLRFLVPPAFIKYKEINYLKQAEKMMEMYYKRDIKFIQEYEKERTEFLLQALGIEEKQFRYINYEIIKARTKPDRDIYQLKCKAKAVILQKDFIINQSSLESSKRVYDKVDYFLNLYTALYDAELCKCIGSIMSRYLILSLKERIAEVDYIVIPKGSNFLLGLEVGKNLHIPVISILEEERIFKNMFFDGNYNEKKTNHIVVIHDVLVTGKRIYESIEKLPADSYSLIGIYSLLKYKNDNFKPLDDFEEHGIKGEKVNWLFEIDETILKEIDEGVYECNSN